MLKKILYWSPRILMILFIAFFILMSLDVFVEDYKWWETLIGFFMHNIPTLLVTGILILSWKKEKIGGILFFIIASVFFFFFRVYNNWEGFLFIILPLLLSGIMFLAHYYLDKKQK